MDEGHRRWVPAAVALVVLAAAVAVAALTVPRPESETAARDEVAVPAVPARSGPVGYLPSGEADFESWHMDCVARGWDAVECIEVELVAQVRVGVRDAVASLTTLETDIPLLADVACPQVAHAMGAAAVAAHPTDDLVVPGQGVCDGGYFTGLAAGLGEGGVERFGAWDRELCTAAGAGEGPVCAEAVGAGLWDVTGGNLDAAFDICASGLSVTHVEGCGTGVMAALITGDSSATVSFADAGDVAGWCAGFASAHRSACLSQTGRLMLRVTPDRAAALHGCAQLPGDFDGPQRCAFQVGGRSMLELGFDRVALVDVCLAGPEDLVLSCAVGAVRDTAVHRHELVDQFAPALCALLPAPTAGRCAAAIPGQLEGARWPVA